MNTKSLVPVLVTVMIWGCKGSSTPEGDAEDDSTEDPADDQDVVSDVSPDTEPPDGEEDVEPDTAMDPTPDTTDTAGDPVVDTPTDTIGMPCTTDEECDMGNYCDGEEYCHPSGVCRRTPGPDCDDGDDCTIDVCDAVLDECVHDLIDDDGDGHAPESCGGDDCDDTDISVYTGAPEVCGDGDDQDCDGRDNEDGECACALPLSPPEDATGDTRGMLAEYGGSCRDSGGAPEVVYELVLASDEDVLFELSAPGWDGIFYVTEGTCDGTELDCTWDSQSASILSLTAGTYYVFVDGARSGEDGEYTLETDICPGGGTAGGADACDDAFVITGDGLYTGETTTFADDTQPATCASDSVSRGGHDAWFELTMTSAATVHLDATCSEFDTIIYVLDGSCTGTEIACNDDAGPGAAAELDVDLDPGTYYIALDGYYTTSYGEYVLSVTGTGL